MNALHCDQINTVNDISFWFIFGIFLVLGQKKKKKFNKS